MFWCLQKVYYRLYLCLCATVKSDVAFATDYITGFIIEETLADILARPACMSIVVLFRANYEPVNNTPYYLLVLKLIRNLHLKLVCLI